MSLIASLPIKFYRSGLPEAEHELAWLIECNLSGIETQIRNFESALALFDYCGAQWHAGGRLPSSRFIEWLHVAARDGAMSIHHAYVCFDGIRENLAACPKLSSLVDRSDLKAAGKFIETAFPTIVDMRDSVAHPSFKTKNARKYNEHAFSGTYEGGGIKANNVTNLTITDSLCNRTYTNSWEGKVISYDISQESFQHLLNWLFAIRKSFEKAEIATRAHPMPPKQTEPQP